MAISPKIYQRYKDTEGSEYVHIDMYEKEKAAREKNHKELFELKKELSLEKQKNDNQFDLLAMRDLDIKNLSSKIKLLKIYEEKNKDQKMVIVDYEKRFEQFQNHMKSFLDNEKKQEKLNKQLKALLKEVL